MTEMKFVKAERKKSKARIAIAAPSGGGKTHSSLLLAKGIAKETGDKIAVIDTERGSASMYEGLVGFDVLDLSPPYTPERYREAIKAAETAGYGICIIDSATHEWSGSGGCLEINEELARARYKGNTWSAWSDTTPRHRDFIDSQMHSGMHIIATFRSKTETVQNSDKKVVKLGMKAESRDNVEYEYSIFFELTHDGHFATASKDRTGLFEGRNFVITEETGKEIVNWLNSGAAPKPEVKVEKPITPTTGEITPKEAFGSKKLMDEKFKEIAKAINDSNSAEDLDAVKLRYTADLETLAKVDTQIFNNLMQIGHNRRSTIGAIEAEREMDRVMDSAADIDAPKPPQKAA